MSELKNATVRDMKDSSVEIEDSMVNIIQDIEVKIVQEEIKRLEKQKNLIKDWSKKKTWFVWTLFALSIPIDFLLLGIAFYLTFGLKGIAFVPIVVILSTMFIGFEILQRSDKPQSLRTDKDQLVNFKRQELFEKSLNVELVHKDSIIDDSWKEIVAFDENEDFVKYLARVVENDNEYETIEAKRLKG